MVEFLIRELQNFPNPRLRSGLFSQEICKIFYMEVAGGDVGGRPRGGRGQHPIGSEAIRQAATGGESGALGLAAAWRVDVDGGSPTCAAVPAGVGFAATRRVEGVAARRDDGRWGHGGMHARVGDSSGGAGRPTAAWWKATDKSTNNK
ncbi:hypothetical protein GUJ93_ZPchr0013g36511 [Zizania palustris]|uniref:Uncharacterized protein n=1 Tax=Zizania palustris TaxID=103762 RepID=A0A8J5X7I7_ZIZPA|nr:hypothetical protein GUJ93_ZPchr0013g36511 [Zizania palustris]